MLTIVLNIIYLQYGALKKKKERPFQLIKKKKKNNDHPSIKSQFSLKEN